MKKLFVVLALLTIAAPLAFADIVGGTIYDWQLNGPAYRNVASAGPHGFYVVWMYSNDTVGTQADRNMRCNYYDYQSHTWNWVDPDFMLSGLNVFTERAGFGSLDVDPTTYGAVVSCHAGNIRPVVARDLAPGAGTFEYCDGSPQLNRYVWPPVAVGANRTIHLAPVDDSTGEGIWYSRAETWCNWQPVSRMSPVPPTFPSQNVAASKVSTKACVTWAQSNGFPYPGRYRLSTDGGATWGPETDLGYPPAFGGGPDTLCSYYVTSLFPFYDQRDRLHIVVDVMPVINDTVWLAPNEIWHWCPDNSPQWSFIHRADFDRYSSRTPGDAALVACRPSIGEDSLGNLFVTWEQFDTTNVEPRTNLMRADVWLSASADNGSYWVPGRRLTGPDSVSRRFPSIIDMAIPGAPDCDTLVLAYMEDQCAGCRAGLRPVGSWTDNPIVVRRIPVDSILPPYGVGAGSTPKTRIGLSVRPSPLSGRAAISYDVPQNGQVAVTIRDVAGRTIATLVQGERAAGRHLVNWNASAVPAGIYFCRLSAGGQTATAKLEVSR